MGSMSGQNYGIRFFPTTVPPLYTPLGLIILNWPKLSGDLGGVV